MSSSEIESRGPAIVTVAIISPIVTSIFVFLRLYVRAFMVRYLGWDDYVVVATLLASIAYSVVISIATYNGMGMHIYDLEKDPALYQASLEWIVIVSEVYLLGLLGYKMAILLTYYRIFGVSQRFRYVCWAVMFFTCGYLISNMLTEVFGCHPLQKFWDPTVPGTCITYLPADIAYGAMNVASDFAIAFLPWRMIWRLQMDRREKIGLFLVFLTGINAFVVALIRWILGCVDLNSYDRPWAAGLTWFWSVLEVNTGLICASCLPLKPVLKFLRRSSIFSGPWSRPSASDPSASPSSGPSQYEKNDLAGRGKQDGSVGSDEIPLTLGSVNYESTLRDLNRV